MWPRRARSAGTRLSGGSATAASSSHRRRGRTGTAERMAGCERRTFPLVPLRRPTGPLFGQVAGRQRGTGNEVIGVRAYEPGDAVSSIDWFASARLSTAHGGDEFVVRAHAADQAPR